MKTLSLRTFALLIGLLASAPVMAADAPGNGTAEATAPLPEVDAIRAKDVIVKTSNIFILIRDGQPSRMDHEMLLGNGSRLLPDGIMVLRDGTRQIVKNGIMITANGEMVLAPPDVTATATTTK